jgi:hypothetical protein
MHEDKWYMILKAFVAKLMMGIALELPDPIIIFGLLGIVGDIYPDLKVQEGIPADEKIPQDTLTEWLIDYIITDSDNEQPEESRRMMADLFHSTLESPSQAMLDKIEMYVNGGESSDLSVFEEFLNSPSEGGNGS